MAQVLLKNLNKKYDEVHAVKDVTLHIRDKEFMVLVGPSGCGKSTTLRMVAGLEEITGGEILIGERVVNDLPPKDRDIAMVFQNYAPYPHMTVAENIGFALVIHFTIDARRVRAEGATSADEDATAHSGEGVARVDPTTRATVGEPMTFAVNTSGLQFFDPDTEQAIWT